MGVGEVSKDLAAVAAHYTTRAARAADVLEYVPRRGTKKLKIKGVQRKLAPVVRRAGTATVRPFNPREPSTLHAMIGKGFRTPRKIKPIDTGLFDDAAEAEKLQLEAFRVKSAKRRASAAEMRRKAFGDIQKSQEDDVFLEMPGNLVEKSFVPGKGWVKATKVSRADRAKIPGAHKQMKGVTPDLERAREAMKVASDFARSKAGPAGDGGSSKKLFKPKYLPNRIIDETVGSNTEAFALKTGGRRGKGHVYARPNASETTLAHERAHITPKRSGFRMYQNGSKPRTRMREEARADYLSGVDYKKKPEGSGYAQGASSEAGRKYHQAQQQIGGRKQFNRPSMTAYRDVQDRMRYAGTKQQSKIKKSFTQMPGALAEESSAEEVLTETLSRARNENLTAVRVRDTKTGKFVPGSNALISKRGEKRAKLIETYIEGRKARNQEKQLEDEMSVTLRKIKRKHG